MTGRTVAPVITTLTNFEEAAEYAFTGKGMLNASDLDKVDTSAKRLAEEMHHADTSSAWCISSASLLAEVSTLSRSDALSIPLPVKAYSAASSKLVRVVITGATVRPVITRTSSRVTTSRGSTIARTRLSPSKSSGRTRRERMNLSESRFTALGLG